VRENAQGFQSRASDDPITPLLKTAPIGSLRKSAASNFHPLRQEACLLPHQTFPPLRFELPLEGCGLCPQLAAKSGALDRHVIHASSEHEKFARSELLMLLISYNTDQIWLCAYPGRLAGRRLKARMVAIATHAISWRQEAATQDISFQVDSKNLHHSVDLVIDINSTDAPL
jgi:hypothetical protein